MQRDSLGSLSAVVATLLLTACGSGGGGSAPPPPTPSPSPSNAAPTANAGSNQTVNASATVTLNGTASSDSDGTVASYAWTQTAGAPSVTLSSSTVSQPTFTAPAVSALTTLSFSLTVTDNRGAASAASTVNVTVNPQQAAGNVTGLVRFTRIPTTNNGLNYASPQLQPARGVVVQAVDAGTQALLISGSTDAQGNYSLAVAANTNIKIVVVAQMLRNSSQSLPRWDFHAQDNDATNPTPYTYTDGTSFSSSAGTAHNIDIPSGFDSSGTVTGTRASAPFAVLDTVYQAKELVLTVAPLTNFPALILDWAADNPGSQTFFDPNGAQSIVLSADPTEDTDEYDQHVVAHEFGHYIEFNFSRADNIGGSHGLGDKLDIRTAFGEGFGYAFGAIVLNDPVTRDTYTSSTQFAGCASVRGPSGFLCTSTFNVDTNPQTNPIGAPNNNYGCWCSESSVWAILWDIYDSGTEANDSVALGFQAMWDVLINNQKTTHAFTSIFSFLDELKRANPGSAAAIDTLAAAQNISSVQDVYGTGETHAPNQGSNGVVSAAALPVYTDITVGGPAMVVRNVDDAGQYNKLGNHRFLKFTLNTARTTTITVRSSNPDVDADPDFLVYRNGVRVNSGQSAPPQPEVLTMTNAAAGDYLLDVYDCANGCNFAGGNPEGIAGDYDITVSVN